MSEIKLKKGDKVVMHTCLESKGKNLGKVWTCRTDSFKWVNYKEWKPADDSIFRRAF